MESQGKGTVLALGTGLFVVNAHRVSHIAVRWHSTVKCYIGTPSALQFWFFLSLLSILGLNVMQSYLFHKLSLPDKMNAFHKFRPSVMLSLPQLPNMDSGRAECHLAMCCKRQESTTGHSIMSNDRSVRADMTPLFDFPDRGRHCC